MLIGIDGTAGAVVRSGAAPGEGAVFGRLRDIRLCRPSLGSSVFNVWRDAALRKCRCSHFFGPSYLLFGAGIVFWLVMVGMLVVSEEAAREDIVR